MSARSVQIMGGPDHKAWAHVDAATNALRVFLVNGSSGGPTADVNIASIGGNVVTTTIPVSGTVAVTQSTSPWTVDGTVTANQGGAWSVAVNNFPATQPVSGTVNVGNFPATVAVTQSTSPWVVSGDVGATLSGTVDAGNSSTTPLGSGATFTGTFVEVTNFAMVTVTVFANVASATGGMKLQWSGDGTNVDREEPITIAAGSAGGRAIALNVRGRYFRVVYTNGGSAQATFRLGTVLHPVGTGLNNVIVDQDIPFTALAILTRSVITGETTAGGGSFVNVKVTPSGAVAAEVTQGTSPWVVSGTVAVSSISGTVAVTQSTSPWVVGQSNRNDLAVNANLRVLDADVDFDNHVPISIYGDGTAGPADVATDGDNVAANSPWSGLMPMFEVSTNPVPDGSSGTWNHAFMTEGGAIYVHVKSDDNIHTSGDVASGTTGGYVVFPVRRNTPTSFGADGFFSYFTVDALERLWCNVNVVTPGTASDNLGKAEDAVAGSGDTGVMALAVRADSPAATGANGDYVPLLTDASGRLHVTVGNATLAVTQSGSWTVAVQGTGAADIGKAEDAVAGSGDTGIMALAVRSDTAAATAANGDYHPLLLDSTGKLHVNVGNATLAVTQSGTWNIGTVTTVTTVSTVSAVSAVTPGTAAGNLGKAEDAVAASGDTGVMALAVRSDTAATTVSNNGDYHPLLVDDKGRLHVNVGSMTFTGAAADITKAEDAAHTSGDAGVMALAVRRDTLTALATTNGDYIPLATDSIGALWTRQVGMVTVALSGSTRGRPIQITGTASGSAVTLHTATTTSGELDRVYIDLTNTGTVSVLATIEFGTTGTGNELKITVPPGETVPAVVGMVIGGAATDTIKAYAATANVINAVGRVERLS